MKEKLLKIRKQLKKRKPAFTRQDINRYPRLEVKWRKPKGLHAKMRPSLKAIREALQRAGNHLLLSGALTLTA